MALSEEQIAQIAEMMDALNVEVNGICEAREDVQAAVRIDATNPDDITAMTVILSAKARAVTHATALVTLLSP